MPKEFFERDDEQGVTTYFDYIPETGEIKLEHVQDIEPYLEKAQAVRNDGIADNGIKESWFHYCDIPLVFVMRMRKMGIRLDDCKAVLEAINTYWPFLKYTRKNEGGKLGTTFDMGKNAKQEVSDVSIILPPE